MISKTKYAIDNETIIKLFKKAGFKTVSDIKPLGAGEFNSVFSAKADGKECALKIAPSSDADVLPYEKNMMTAEIFWYGLIRENTNIRVPNIYFTDFTKSIIPTEYFIMEKLDGAQPYKMHLSLDEKAQLNAELAKMAAQIHKVRNDKFGYVQLGLYDDWYQAIRAMTLSLIEGCRLKGYRTKRGERLLAYIDKYSEILKKAESRMVNFDMCLPNILAKRTDGKIEYQWIDPERGFWGDRIAEFVSIEAMKPISKMLRTIKAYNSVSDSPVEVTREVQIRYAVMTGYLSLIMEAEKYYRYSTKHFGWWRNVFGCAMFYKMSFRILKANERA